MRRKLFSMTNNNSNRQNNRFSRSRLGRVTAAHAQPDLHIRRISLLAIISKLLLQCSLLVIVISCVTTNFGAKAQGQITVDDDFARLLGKCKTGSAEFDDCMKEVFNDLRAYFATGKGNSIKNIYGMYICIQKNVFKIIFKTSSKTIKKMKNK